MRRLPPVVLLFPAKWPDCFIVVVVYKVRGGPTTSLSDDMKYPVILNPKATPEPNPGPVALKPGGQMRLGSAVFV